MKIKLICDSLCDIPLEIQEKEYLEVVPLTIILNQNEYKDGIDITKEEYYDVLKTSDNMPKTSQATYAQFSEVFKTYIAKGYKIICINGSSKASGTFQSATLARNDMYNKKNDIYLFDTLNLSLGSGQYIIKACELIEQDSTCEEIIEQLEKLRESVSLLFAPSTLEYLKRSGRVSLTTALIGNMLNLKPIFSFTNGEIDLLEKARGNKNLTNRLVDLILEKYENNLEDKIITIGCGANFNQFEKLKIEVEKRLNPKKVYITRGGACICSHTGPDILAISCSK